MTPQDQLNAIYSVIMRAPNLGVTGEDILKLQAMAQAIGARLNAADALETEVATLKARRKDREVAAPASVEVA